MKCCFSSLGVPMLGFHLVSRNIALALRTLRLDSKNAGPSVLGNGLLYLLFVVWLFSALFFALVCCVL